MHPGPGERVTCLRSGLGGGSFIFEFEVAPNGKGPPRHTHDEGDEIIAVTRGVLEVEVNGQWRRLGPGEAVTLRPSDVHTFRNGSKDAPVVCEVVHGSRFERAIVQRSFLDICYYLAYVDPGVTRMRSLAVRALMRAMAFIAKLAGAARRSPVAPQ